MIGLGDIAFYDTSHGIRYSIATFPVGSLPAVQTFEGFVLNFTNTVSPALVFKPKAISNVRLLDAVRVCFSEFSGIQELPIGMILHKYLSRLHFNDALMKKHDPKRVSVIKLLQIIAAHPNNFQKISV